jgi:pimeloyl-ACP methyl ester carboxylesterase
VEVVGAYRQRAHFLARVIGIALPLSTARGESFSAGTAAIAAEKSDDGARQGPVRMEPLSPEEKPPTYVLRGGPTGSARMVFLHGMCGHALGYAQSFQFTAARWGKLVAPQGDKPCQGPWASWSTDLEALDARIVDAFHRLGQNDPIDDIIVIGYSQGAMRAEDLARRWPARYTRLVLMASPRVASPRGFDRVRSSVMMAGERDRQDLMKQSARAFAKAGIPSTFMIIPEATHGAMGPTPEKTMSEALEWLFAHER